jgi:hypothetical protein
MLTARSRLQPVTIGSVIAVLIALVVGVLIGRLTAPNSPENPEGPRANKAGVPVGYAHSPQGAIAAASNYLTFLGNPSSIDPRRLDAGLSQIAAPGSEQHMGQIRAVFSNGQQQLVQAGANRAGPLISQNKQLGYRLTRYGEDKATIAIWDLDLGGNASNLAPSAAFSTTTLDLQWANGDWKLVDYNDAAGPAPQVQQAPSPPPQFVSNVQQYKGFRNAP